MADEIQQLNARIEDLKRQKQSARGWRAWDEQADHALIGARAAGQAVLDQVQAHDQRRARLRKEAQAEEQAARREGRRKAVAEALGHRPQLARELLEVVTRKVWGIAVAARS